MNGREEVTKTITTNKAKNILAELPTSFGKTKIALEWLKDKKGTTLIVVPRLVLIDSWLDEMQKWNVDRDVTFSTYVSLHKHAGYWDNIIFDECHHLSDRCFDILESYTWGHSILLSATVNRNKKWQIRSSFNVFAIKVSPREAIEENILPDPKVYLIPLELDNTKEDWRIVKNAGKGTPMVVPFKDRFKYTAMKHREIIIPCTQKQYYSDMCSLIDYYKRKSFMQRFKNLYLHKCGDRLKWLSSQKTEIGHFILSLLRGERVLTFCHSIEQTEKLGKHCINSKNKDALKELESFNDGKINHITACAMLDEGVNLKNCQYGLFINLNASERMQKQRLGRLLRHKEPIIIIPYFKDTRDEEILNKMLLDYNKDLVSVVNLNDLKGNPIH